MKYTIAIPVYNCAATVGRSIESALNQDFDADYEVLIVDNASTDNTWDVIQGYAHDHPRRVKAVRNPRNIGMFGNHNECLRQAEGDYVTFCHSDDELLPHSLKIIDSVLAGRLYPERYVLWGHGMLQDHWVQYALSGQGINTAISGEAALQTFTESGWGVTPSGTTYSRKALLDMGGFPELDTRYQAQDWSVLIMCVFARFEFEMTDRLLVSRTYPSTALESVPHIEHLRENAAQTRWIMEHLQGHDRNLMRREIATRLHLTQYPYAKRYMTRRERWRRMVKAFAAHPTPHQLYVILRAVFTRL